jgi:hypothetical protein
MVPSFLKVLGDPAFRPYADVNKDGAINGADVSGLVPNFLNAGPITVSAARQQAASAAAQAASATGASLSLAPADSLGHVTDVMTMDIMANTGTGAPDTVQVDLNFDPNYVVVLNAAGSAATSIDLLNSTALGNVYYNNVDNAAGHVDIAATNIGAGLPAGSFRVATIRFMAKAPVSGSPITFVHSGARTSDLWQGGVTINPTLTNGSVSAGPAPYSNYLPLIRR